MRTVTKIILHYLGPGSGAQWQHAAEAVTAIRSWHLAQGYNDIGYHYVVAQSGDVAAGRPEDQVGAHAYGANTGSIGICCCIGTGDLNTPRPMLASTARLIADVADRHGVPLDRAHVIGHRDVPGEGGATACPGQLYPLIPELIEMARQTATPTITLDGRQIGEALLVDGQSYAPVRRLAEALGLSVGFDAASKTVSLSTSKK